VRSEPVCSERAEYVPNLEGTESSSEWDLPVAVIDDET